MSDRFDPPETLRRRPSILTGRGWSVRAGDAIAIALAFGFIAVLLIAGPAHQDRAQTGQPVLARMPG